MKTYLVLAAVLMVAACGKKDEATPAADSTAVMPESPAVNDSIARADSMKADSMMARDTAHKM
ncbi:MAG: hypothetical protein ABI742_02520 [Gemmatimonadota bacterium]